MKRKFSFSLSTVLIFILLACLLTFQLTYSFVGKQYQAKIDGMNASDFPLLAEADSLIREYFLRSVDSDNIQEMLIRSYVSSLNDPYSRYLNAEEYAAYKTTKSGSGFGIGVRVVYNEEKDQLIIYSVFADSPAEEAGLQKGDVIDRVDGIAVSELGASAAVNAITGEAGTRVKLSVKRELGAQYLDLEFSVDRREIRIQSVSYEMLENSVGYVQIFTFDELTAEQFSAAVNDLVEQGASSLIFDLRGNGGGRLDAVCSMLDFLLPEGDLVRTVSRSGKEEVIKSDASGIDLPMAVLINSSSASASEIFAFAIRNFGAGVLVGETTYGKGTAQIVLEMQDGSALILTNLEFAPPNSESLEGIGVKPDFPVKLAGTSPYLLTAKEDNQLQAAVSALLSLETGEEPQTEAESSTADS